MTRDPGMVKRLGTP